MIPSDCLLFNMNYLEILEVDIEKSLVSLKVNDSPLPILFGGAINAV